MTPRRPFVRVGKQRVELPAGDVLPTDALGTGTRDATTALHGDGVYRVPAGAIVRDYGVSIAGAEFDHTTIGTEGVEYRYDDLPGANNSRFAYYTDKGLRCLRIPLMIERIYDRATQTLYPSAITRINDLLTSAQATGVVLLFDFHQYARWWALPWSTPDGTPWTSADGPAVKTFTAKFAQQFAGHGNFWGIEINEPYDLIAELGTFTGTNRYDWTSTTQGWIRSSGPATTVSVVDGKLRLSISLAAGDNFLRMEAPPNGGVLPGGVLRMEVTVPADGPSVKARAEWQTGSPNFAWQQLGFATVNCPTGATTVVQQDHGTIADTANAFGFQIDATVAAATTLVIDIDNYAQGSVTGGRAANEVWHDLAQQTLDGYRLHSSKVYCAQGYQYAGSADWRVHNENFNLVDPANNTLYTAHVYFDKNRAGDYFNPEFSGTPSTYEWEEATEQTGVQRAQPFLDWLTEKNKLGMFTEFGIPNDDVRWITLQNNFVNHIVSHPNIRGLVAWAGGPRWGTYRLSLEPTNGVDAPQMATIANRPTTVEMATKAAFDAHATNTTNPHAVTSNQVGSKVSANGAPDTAIGTTATLVGSVTITPKTITSKIALTARADLLKDTGTTMRSATLQLRRGTANTDPQVGLESMVDSQPVASTRFGPAVITTTDAPGVTTAVTYSLWVVGAAAGGTVPRFEITAAE